MSVFRPSLGFTHRPVAKLPESDTQNILGAIHFTDVGANPELAHDIPQLNLAARILQGHPLATELWTAEAPLSEMRQHGHVVYRHNANYLFGVITLPELAETADTSSLQLTTEQAYNEIFQLMAALDYTYIYRFWNYIADINRLNRGLERYWQFNAGRKDAFATHANTIGEQYPAACALGLVKGPLSIAFLLGKDEAPIAIENPRQISAYEYPEQYGPRTPSFSRATLVKSTNTATLFISGTASIIGHETQHLDDPIAQTQETLANLQIVLDQANQQLDQPLFQLNDLLLRVYLRKSEDLAVVQQVMQHQLGDTSKAIFILADICRQDLLLEIEATGQVELTQAELR
jgi:enamine deaminase RidA (YjgF/YER057c/UK114 family)